MALCRCMLYSKTLSAIHTHRYPSNKMTWYDEDSSEMKSSFYYPCHRDRMGYYWREDSVLKDDNKLTFHLSFSTEIGSNFSDSSSLKFFKFFSNLSSNYNRSVCTKIRFHFSEGFLDTMNWLIKYNCIVLLFEWIHKCLTSFFYWKKAKIKILVTIHSTRHECRKYCRSSWNWGNSNPCFNRFFNENISWIRDTRSPCIRNKSNVFPFFEKLYNLFYFWESWMWVKRKESSSIFQIIVYKELSRHTSILTGNIISFSKYSECPKSDIFKIANWCRNDRKHTESYIFAQYISFATRSQTLSPKSLI